MNFFSSYYYYFVYCIKKKYFRPVKKGEARPPLRQYLMDGDFFIGAALGTTLAKLAFRYNSLVKDDTKKNRFTSEVMLIM